MSYLNYIVSDHHTMLGEPDIKGTRLTVELILHKMGEGAKNKDLLEMYPSLDNGAIQAVLQ